MLGTLDSLYAKTPVWVFARFYSNGWFTTRQPFDFAQGTRFATGIGSVRESRWLATSEPRVKREANRVEVRRIELRSESGLERESTTHSQR
jgi:hypothetical protein